jgi:YVTN family beta-propeller protein
MAMHPDGRFLYVVNSNFNARYRPDSGGTVSVIDTRSLEIKGDRTPFLPSFGGSIELNDDASKAYVTAREGNTLVAYDVAGPDSSVRPGGALFCRDDEGNPTSNPEECWLREVPSNGTSSRLSTDPFDLAVTTIDRENPETGEQTPIDLVNLAYIGSNRVSTISLPDRNLQAASMQTAALINGGNRIVQRPDTLSYYVAGRNSNLVARFTPFVNTRESSNFGQVEALFRQGEIVLSNFTSGGQGTAVNARGLGFSESGDRLYVATRQPDALHIFELGASDPETGEGLAHEWNGSVSLPDQPSDLLVVRDPKDRTRLYIPSAGDESIAVVDPDSQTVVDTIELGGSPQDMVVDTADNRCSSPGEQCRGYVSLFEDTGQTNQSCGPDTDSCGAVGVIDLDPASPRYHQLIRKIE